MKKALMIAGGIACLLVGGYLVWRKSEKEIKEVEESEAAAAEEEETEESEAVEEEEQDEVKEEDNPVKSMYSALRFNTTDFDLDLIDLNNILREDGPPPLGIIHVDMSEYRGQDYLTYFMEIPIDKVRDRDIPGTVGVFRRAIENIEENIFPLLPKDTIRGKLVGKFILEREDEIGGKEYESYIIDKSLYDTPEFTRVDRDGRKISGLFNYVKSKSEELKEGPAYFEDASSGNLVRVKNFILGFCIEIPIVSGEFPAGANSDRAIKALRYLMNYDDDSEVKIKLHRVDDQGRTRTEFLEYEGALFQNPYSYQDEVYSAEKHVTGSGKTVYKVELVAINW